MIITKNTSFDFGDTVTMVNDPDENVGIVAAYQINPPESWSYLVTWNPSMSSWHNDFEIKHKGVEDKRPFNG